MINKIEGNIITGLNNYKNMNYIINGSINIIMNIYILMQKKIDVYVVIVIYQIINLDQ